MITHANSAPIGLYVVLLFLLHHTYKDCFQNMVLGFDQPEVDAMF